MTYHEQTKQLSNHHQRQEEYTYRMPEFPKLGIPHLNSSEAIQIGPVSLNPHLYNVDYFNSISPIECHPDKPYAWDYEARRQMQEILPFLYLGPASAVPQFLQHEGASLLIGVQLKGINFIGRAVQAGQKHNVTTHTIMVGTPNDLISNFQTTTKLINDHINTLSQTIPPTLPKILVFCETGSEKSAAVVAAYLAETYSSLDMKLAMRICISRRFSCNFGNLTNLLDTYEQLLNARNTLSPSLDGQMTVPEPIQRVRTPDMNNNFRRGRDQFLHNVDDEEYADRERFKDRIGPQPFKDY